MRRRRLRQWYETEPEELKSLEDIQNFVVWVFSLFSGREPSEGSRQLVRYISKLDQKKKEEFYKAITSMEKELDVLRKELRNLANLIKKAQ